MRLLFWVHAKIHGVARAFSRRSSSASAARAAPTPMSSMTSMGVAARKYSSKSSGSSTRRS
jgi:hypothetical protein